MVLTRQACSAQDFVSGSEPSTSEHVLAVKERITRQPTTASIPATASPPATASVPATASPPTSPQPRIQPLRLLDLPQEMLERILYWLSYKTLAQIRPVCQLFNHMASHILTSCFRKLQGQILGRFKEIKAQMPRRDSARRKHPLARESDIIETLHMRLSLLHMTFGKHMERQHICFFPGEILDEVYRILHYIQCTPTLGVAFKVTDELFDLSSMAMEYFREHIEPQLPEINAFFTPDFLDFSSSFDRSSTSSLLPLDSSDHMTEHSFPSTPEFFDNPLPPSNMVLRKRIQRIRQGMKRYNTQLAVLRRELKACKGTVADQHRQIREYATRLDEYDRKFDESSKKFSTLLQELNKCKTELQYWRSKSPAGPTLCSSCGSGLGAQSEDLQLLAHQGVRVEQLLPGTSEIVHTCKKLFEEEPQCPRKTRQTGERRRTPAKRTCVQTQ